MLLFAITLRRMCAQPSCGNCGYANTSAAVCPTRHASRLGGKPREFPYSLWVYYFFQGESDISNKCRSATYPLLELARRVSHTHFGLPGSREYRALRSLVFPIWISLPPGLAQKKASSLRYSANDAALVISPLHLTSPGASRSKSWIRGQQIQASV
jgi:hypothetical protein